MKFFIEFLAWLFGKRRSQEEVRRDNATLSKYLSWPSGRPRRRKIWLVPRRWSGYCDQRQYYESRAIRRSQITRRSDTPYLFAVYAPDHRQFLDLSLDGDDSLLTGYRLPVFHTPQELADWLGVRVGELAWLVH